MAPAWSVSWQPLATARYSKVCWVKESGLVAATLPAISPPASLAAAARMAAEVIDAGGGRIRVGEAVGGQGVHEPERRGGQNIREGPGGAGAGHLGLELILPDGDQLDRDVGLLLEPVDDPLRGLNP